MTRSTTSVVPFHSARAVVLARVAAACERVGRSPNEVTLVAVSKTVPSSRLRDAVAAGLTILAENRVQEGEAKAPQVPGATWQLVGPLQSNKARRALDVFDAIQSVDSVALAERLDRLARDVRGAGPEAPYPILLQVNVDDDPSKAGFDPGGLPEALDVMAGLTALDVRGLMTIGRFVTEAEAARVTFAALRELSSRFRDAGAALGPDLSMGMTDDFEIAVEEGATMIRVGRALFGERPHHHEVGEVGHD